ncbi:Nitroreductase [Trichodelitschia bisporula]|uniref:Nitroreductase n=1 Tax=Trichodelitschia bisporula TaxID=703511 RepID=A0A6G1HQG6_9PEZI|nr:Nitroreductase [Trichodelitschia bisporula]
MASRLQLKTAIGRNLPIRQPVSSTLVASRRLFAIPKSRNHTFPGNHFHLNSSLRTFSSTSTMASSSAYLDAVKARRTIYALNNKAPISDERIEEIVKDVVLNTPSSFNSQSARLVVLLKEEHERFWDFVKEVLRPQVPEDQFPKTEQRLNTFRAGYGTILFFEDPAPVDALKQAFPLYAEHFPVWSEHTSAMHQIHLWTALEAEGFGANLQHYNPVIDQKAQNYWNIPQEWALRAQLVFGGRASNEAPAPKEQKTPVESRVFVHGK